jgi:hypothetical protein
MGDAMNDIETTQPSHNYLRQMHCWRMAFFGLVILLAGIVLGASSLYLLGRRPKPPLPPLDDAARRLLNELRDRLDLSPEQMDKIGPILQKYMGTLEEIRIAAFEQITKQLELMNEEVSSVLDEHQRRLWEGDIQGLHRGFRPRSPREERGHRGPPMRQYGPERGFRRGPGPFGPRRDQGSPNRPWNDSFRGPPIIKDVNTPNELP